MRAAFDGDQTGPNMLIFSYFGLALKLKGSWSSVLLAHSFLCLCLSLFFDMFGSVLVIFSCTCVDDLPRPNLFHLP